MAFDKTTFATDIRTKRIIKERKSLRDLADTLGIKHLRIWNFENEFHVPDIETLQIICKWLGEDIKKYLK